VGGRGGGAPTALLVSPEGRTGCEAWIAEVPLDSKVELLVLDSGFSGTISSSSSRVGLNSYNML